MKENKTSYRIIIKSISSGGFLVYRSVPEYKIKDGMIHFLDNKGRPKIYSTSNCEIEIEEPEEKTHFKTERG